MTNIRKFVQKSFYGVLAQSKFVFSCFHVIYRKPLYIFISILFGPLLLITGIWLANIHLFGVILTNQLLSTSYKFSYILGQYKLPFQYLGWFQLFLLLVFIMLGALISAQWWYALTRSSEEIVKEHAGLGLSLAIVGNAIGLYGISLFMPILTTQGPVINVDGQVYGSLIVITGITIVLCGMTSLNEGINRLKKY